MQNLNIDILIQNVQQLMTEHKLTQQLLADAIGMSQPNFNRAINNKDGQRFTLEQVCDIATYFNVSVDFLLGFEKQTIQMLERDICTLFTSLLEQRKLIKIDVEREEEIYKPILNFDSLPDYEKTNKVINYQAFLFPEYLDYGPLDRFNDSEIENLQFEVYTNGNQDEGNQRINSFFKKYFPIYDLYLHNQITEELFHEIVEKFLDDLI